MTLYTLSFDLVGEPGAEGSFELVSIEADGYWQKGRCTARLALEGHDSHPGCCNVTVPPCDLVNREPLARFADHNHWTTREGVRTYDFATRQEALDFLCSLYGIDASQPDPEPTHAPQPADTPSPVQQVTVSPRSVPAPLARDVVPCPVPTAPGRPTGPFLPGAASYPHPVTHHPRNTQ